MNEFRVENSERITGYCVTNDEYSVVLLKENESNMVCNMLNRLLKNEMLIKNKVELEDIIEIVKTNVPTNSVELKKDLYRDTEKRFKFVCDDENCFFKDNGKVLDCYEVVDVLNNLYDEIEQLKSYNKKLKLDNQRIDIALKNNQLAYYDLQEELDYYKSKSEEVQAKTGRE